MRALFLSLLVLLFVMKAQSAVDQTITPKGKGRDVADAVVDRIVQSCIFPNDRLMLRRISYAETQDGSAGHTFTTNGGIWQVDESSFRSSKSKISSALETKIRQKFGIEWNQVQFSELDKPLHSGLAARMKINSYYSSRDLPQSVGDQADYWATQYTVNTWSDARSTYMNASSSLTTSCASPKADVVFVVDASGSIKSYNFVSVKEFVKEVVRSFDVSQSTVRIGLIKYSDFANSEFNLTTYDNKQDVLNAVDRMTYPADGTNSAAGLDLLTSLIVHEGRHKDGVSVTAIFLTDGRSNNKEATERSARELHRKLPEVTVFSVGVGSNIDADELETIASEPACTHVFELSSFDDITEFNTQIMSQACKAPAQLAPGKEISGKLDWNQFYYFKIKVVKGRNGVRVKLKVKVGGVKIYFSWKVQNPNGALYDTYEELDAQNSDEGDIHIPWSDEALAFLQNQDNSGGQRSKREQISDETSEVEADLYGSIVGAKQGSNEFSMSYKDDSIKKTANLLTLMAAGLIAYLNY